MLGYMGFYLCRQNFAEAYAPMKTALGMDKATFGAIASFGTLVYAIGKLLSGALADARGGRTVFLIGLVVSAAASCLFGSVSGIWLFFVVWGLNRLAQSMGWGSLVNVIAQWYTPRERGTAMGVMSISYQFGGALASVFAGTLLAMGMGWRGLFIIPGITLGALGLLLSMFIVGSPKHVGYDLPEDDAMPDGGVDAEDEISYLQRYRLVFQNRGFLAMCALSFILTFIRECFTLWMPAYFSDMGASASIAAFKSAIFPILGCLGTVLAGWYSDRFLSGRRTTVLGVFLVGLVLSLTGLVFAPGGSTLSLVLVGATGFFLFGPYSMVGGGVIALDFGGRKTAGTAAGILDSAGYLAATFSGFGIAKLAATSGWSATFTLLAAFAAAAVLLCVFMRFTYEQD